MLIQRKGEKGNNKNEINEIKIWMMLYVYGSHEATPFSFIFLFSSLLSFYNSKRILLFICINGMNVVQTLYVRWLVFSFISMNRDILLSIHGQCMQFTISHTYAIYIPSNCFLHFCRASPFIPFILRCNVLYINIMCVQW